MVSHKKHSPVGWGTVWILLWCCVAGCGEDPNATGTDIADVSQDGTTPADSQNSDTAPPVDAVGGIDAANADIIAVADTLVDGAVDGGQDTGGGGGKPIEDTLQTADSVNCGDSCEGPEDSAVLDSIEAEDGWLMDTSVPQDGAMIDTAADGANETPTDATVGVSDTTGMSVADLLIGRWEMVGIKDSGNPFEPVPPGAQFFIFTKDLVKFQCENPNGAPYTLLQNDTVVEVQLGPDSKVMWKILELDAEDFVFYEGGDEFYLKRRKPCPEGP